MEDIMRVDPNALMKKFKELGFKAYETAQCFGVHPSTIYRWRKRARLPYGKDKFRHTGLQRKSTKPHTRKPSVLSSEDRIRIETLRKKTNWDYSKLHYALQLIASPSSVYRFLSRKGMLDEAGSYRRPLAQDTIHMHVKNVTTIGKLQMDVKYITPELSGLPYTCFEYAIIDIYSRYKDAIIAPNLDSWGSIAALRILLPALPFKVDFIQTDNGLEFQSAFIEFLKQNNIQQHFIHKSTPNENAVIERSFRTDEEEFFFWQYRKAADLHDLNNQFQTYLHHYNHERPHLGINLQTPIQVVANVLKD